MCTWLHLYAVNKYKCTYMYMYNYTYINLHVRTLCMTGGCNLPELFAELLDREAAMLMALDRREAGMVDCPARD